MSRTAVELYLDSKNIDYRLDGVNATFNCPFCGETEGKFGINIETWQGHCFKSKCDIGVNEISFKRQYGDSVRKEYGISNLEEDSPVTTISKAQPKKEVLPDVEKHHKMLLENDAVLNYLNDDRGFSLETVKAAKLGLCTYRFGPPGTDGVPTLMFPYFRGKNCIGYKYKPLPPTEKDFRFSTGWDVGLYNENVVKQDMESLIICEGETDVLALLNQGYTNVVGISGAKSKKVEYADLLDLPKKMYLVLDNDEAGVDGARTFANRFGVDRFHIVNIPHDPLDVPVVDKHGERTTINDVNEYFQIGHTKEEFDELLAVSRPYDIEGVTTMDDAFDEIIKKFNQTGTFLPKYRFMWDSVQIRAKGMDDGDLVVVLAPAKTGKTTWCLNQAEFMAETYGINIHFDCLEMEADALTKKWAASILCKDEDLLTREDMEQARVIARSRPNGFNFTRSNPNNLDEYLDFLRKIRRRYDSGVIVVDNFQILVDLTIGRGNSNNRPSYMSMVSKKLKALANELRVPIILISQPKGVEEGKMISSNDSEGSTTLTKDCDLFFTLNRAAEARMTLAQAATINKIETNASHSDTMWVDIALSRRSPGGRCTLKIDGAKSIIREFDDIELNANTKKVLAGGIEISQEAVTI